MTERIETPAIFDKWYKGFPNALRNKLAISEIAHEGCGYTVCFKTDSKCNLTKSELSELANFISNNCDDLIESLNKYGCLGYYVKSKKYYVHFIKGDSDSYYSDSYLNYGLDSENYFTNDKEQISCVKTQFTKEEIRAINPNYLLFIEEVPNDKLDKVEDYE